MSRGWRRASLEAGRIGAPLGRRLLPPALLAGLMLLSACSGRERANPFDPLNPDTGGEPHGTRAQAGCGRVELRWGGLGMADIEGFRLWRRAPEEAPGESLLTAEPLPAASRAYADEALANGTLYEYAVEFLFRDGSARLRPVAARPGAALVWCGDPCGWGLQRLAPDARHAERAGDHGAIVFDLDIDLEGGRLFAADLQDGGRIWTGPTDGGGPLVPLAAPGATGVSWSRAARALAVASFFESRVAWMTDTGTLLRVLETRATPRLHPEAVAFRDSSCTWIALADSSKLRGRVLRVGFDSGRVDTVDAPFARPVALADDPAAGGCWVADRGGAILYYVSADLAVASSEPGALARPVAAAADGEGNCWVADAGALVRFDRACVEGARLEGVGGAHGLAVDPLTGQLWVTLPDRGEVLVLRGGDSPGDTLGLGAVAGCPVDIAGDWSGGCR